jgi:hypothetical protein
MRSCADFPPVIAVLALAAVLALLGGCASAPGTPLAGEDASPIGEEASPAGAAPHRIVIAHGTGGGPGGWPTALANAITTEYGPLHLWEIHVLDWRDLSERPLTAARRGYRLGLECGAGIAESTRRSPGADGPRVLHLVAHSMGSHLIQGIADGVRRYESNHPDLAPAVIHMTFLDAFHPRGLLTSRWGIRVFGRGADFAESYVTRDEPAFLTNALLNRTFSFDLTATVPPRANPSSGYFHNWPPAYYAASVGDRTRPGFVLSPLAVFGDRSVARAEVDRAMETLRGVLPAGEVRGVGPRVGSGRSR